MTASGRACAAAVLVAASACGAATELPDAGTDVGAPDAGTDVGGLDAGADGGPPLACGARPTGDARWPRSALPGTPGGPARSYMLEGADMVLDCVTGLEWQRAVEPGSYTQPAAVSYCDDLVLGGRDDWRLPSRIELLTLVDYDVANPGPTIDGTVFPDTPGAIFWSASIVAGEPGYGWQVAFDTGAVRVDAATARSDRARCVR